MMLYFVNWMCFLLWMVIIACEPSGVESIETYDYEDSCGLNVSKDNSVGKLLFTATGFSRYNGKAPQICTVTVTPAPLPGSTSGKVLFYFEKFHLPSDCDEVNLTLYDGPSTNTATVKGAPNRLCGYNSTLTYRKGMIFNTTGGSFTLKLRWTDVHVMYLGLGFELKYAAYYEGTCGEDVVTCQNGRCASEFYHCHVGIDTCGGGEESTCWSEERWNSEGDPIVYIATVATAASAIAIGIMWVFKLKIINFIRRALGSVANFLRYKCCGEMRQDQRPNALSLDPVEDGNRGNASESFAASSFGPAFSGFEPSGYPLSGPPTSDLQSKDAQGTMPLVAPPSYDSVLSNEDYYQNKQ